MESASPDLTDTSSPTEEAPPRTRSSQHFRQLYLLIGQRWPEYLIEILVIILGITLSFALDEWKEENQKRSQERIYLKSLLNDIREDIRELEGVIAETRMVIRKTQVLLQYSNHADTLRVVPAQFYADTRDMMRRPNFIAKDATFSDLQGSGNLQLITNLPLKSALFEYYKEYEMITKVETAERETANFIMIPYLMKRLSLRDLAIDQTRLRYEDVQILLNEVEFGNNVTVRLLNREELLEDYEALLSQAKELHSQLEKQVK